MKRKRIFFGWMKYIEKQNKNRKAVADSIGTLIHVTIATKLANEIQKHLKNK